MLASLSSPVGRKTQTEPYSFSAEKPVRHRACTKSPQVTSPGSEDIEGMKKMVLNTFKARLSTLKTGSVLSSSGVPVAAAPLARAESRAIPRVFVWAFGVGTSNLELFSSCRCNSDIGLSKRLGSVGIGFVGSVHSKVRCNPLLARSWRRRLENAFLLDSSRSISSQNASSFSSAERISST